MPVIEELPEDYESETCRWSTKDANKTTSSSCGASSNNTTVPTSNSNVPARVPGKVDGEKLDQTGCSSRPQGEDSKADSDVVDVLRERLLAVSKAVAEARKKEAETGVSESKDSTEAGIDCEALERSLKPLRSKWVTSSVKATWDKINREITGALADMRVACNDSRRSRTREEILAAAELRRAAEEATDRVKKAAEAVTHHNLPKADKTAAVTVAFHALPLTAKLRVLSADRAGLLLIISSFLIGLAVMAGALLEISSAWNCSFKC